MIKSKDIVKDNVKDRDKDNDDGKDTDYRWIKEVKGMFFHTLVESANVLMLCEQRQRQKQLDKDKTMSKTKTKTMTNTLITEELKKLNGCFSNFGWVCQVVIAVREKQALNPTSTKN